ncbi:MAG: radical SAM protein [Spirochaetales bacterium]|nr:radical SAM protein [Spirochaetales bacterium]
MNLEAILLTKPVVKITSSLLRSNKIRKLGATIIDKTADKRLLNSKPDYQPVKMIMDQKQIVNNMVGSFDRWADSKNLSKTTFERFIKSFVSMYINAKSPRQEFKSKYGFSSPGFLTISPTKLCNLKCKGCYASSASSENVSLSFDVVNRIIQEEKDLWGSHFVVISGGEPFMYISQGKDILDLAELHPDTFFLVYTNGTLITKEIASRIAALGNVTPAVSVEGYEAETDERRGDGVYSKILQSFENLKNAGVIFGLSVTATKDNAEIILSPEFVNLYMKKYGVQYMWIFQYMPIGRGQDLELMVTPEQRFDMLNKTRKWMYDEGLFIADFWNSATLSKGCISAGRHDGGGYIYIDWNGNVMPCVFNPYTSDNILDVYNSGGNLNDVLFSPLMKRIREWQKDYLTDPETGFCKNMLTPCPIRDHHKSMREIIDETNAQPADKAAEIALNDKSYYVGMCRYGEAIGSITKNKWETEFLEIEKKTTVENAVS